MQLIRGAGRLTPPAGGAGVHWVEHLRVPDLSVGTYSIPVGGTDTQQPHTEDEIYVITAGRATLVAGPGAIALDGGDPADTATQRQPVAPGAVVYVAAGEVHRFVEITADFAALVLFAPAEESRTGQRSRP
jgi:mannose-6-phosphate isomerase-like protein (cupin superfamily)